MTMDDLTVFLANPVIGTIGYVLSLIAAIIAITQVFAKRSAFKIIEALNVEVTAIKNENSSLKLSIKQSQTNNSITQGTKSQFFQDNTGPVKIDNRG